MLHTYRMKNGRSGLVRWLSRQVHAIHIQKPIINVKQLSMGEVHLGPFQKLLGEPGARSTCLYSQAEAGGSL